MTVMAYIMTGELWRDPAIPSPSYYGGILEGYKQKRLAGTRTGGRAEECP